MSANSATPGDSSNGATGPSSNARAPSEDRRIVLESIAFGADAKITPGDRLKALEQLREFERGDAIDDGLTEEQIWAEVDSFYCMMLSAMFIGSGPEAIETGELDPARFPQTAQALRSAVGRFVERVVAEHEAAGLLGRAA